MCAKVIFIFYTYWATYNNQKTTPGQEFTSTIFGLLGGFKITRLKWHILPLVWVVQQQNAFSLLHGATPSGANVIGSRSALTMSPTRAIVEQRMLV